MRKIGMGVGVVIALALGLTGCSGGSGSKSATPLSVAQLKVELTTLAAKLKCSHAAFHDESDDTKGGVSASACYPPGPAFDVSVDAGYHLVMFPSASLRDAWVSSTRSQADGVFVTSQTARGGYWAVEDLNDDGGKPVIAAVGGTVAK